MKIVHPHLVRQIDFSKEEFYALIIENQKEFFSLTKELYNQVGGGEGNFVLSEKCESLSIEKNVLFIYDYFSIGLNSKRIDNLLNASAINIIKEGDYIELITELNQKFIEFHEKVVDSFDLDVTYDDDLTFEKLVKLANYKISYNNDLLESILTYIDIHIKLQKIKVVVLVGAQTYFSQEEFDKLLKQIEYYDINLLLIDNRRSLDLKGIKCYTIDDDLCEI